MKKTKFISFIIAYVLIFSRGIYAAENCGETVSDANLCVCAANNNHVDTLVQGSNYCCGYYGKDGQSGKCSVYEDPMEYYCGETSDSATVPDGVTCNCAGTDWQPWIQSNIIGYLDRGICCGWPQDKSGWGWEVCKPTDPALTTARCGDSYPTAQAEEMTCICSGGGNNDMGNGQTCCGFLRDGTCHSSESGINDIEVTDETLNELNPILIAGGSTDLSTPGGVISHALSGFIFPIAGIILFAVIVLGGFEMLSGAADSKSIESGKQKITSAIVGFIILFAAYWIAQLLEIIFGIRILS